MPRKRNKLSAIGRNNPCQICVSGLKPSWRSGVRINMNASWPELFVTARNQRGTGKTRNGLGVRQVRQDPALFKLQDEARAEKRGLWRAMVGYALDPAVAMAKNASLLRLLFLTFAASQGRASNIYRSMIFFKFRSHLTM